MYELIRRVSEEAAGQRAHRQGRYAAVKQELAEAQAALAGPYLRHRDQRGGDHDEAVAYIRHHQSIEQDEERRHKGVCVNGSVSREAVHVRDHVERICEFVVLELHRDCGVLVLGRILGLPCAVVLFEYFGKLGLALRGHPALHYQNVCQAVELILGFGAGDLRAEHVSCELELVAVLRKLNDVLRAACLLVGKLMQFLLGGCDTFARGAVHTGDGCRGKAEAAHAVHNGGVLLLHADQNQILLHLVRIDQKQLCFLRDRCERALHRGEVRAAGDRSQHYRAALSFGCSEGHVKRRPRLQRVNGVFQTADLRADAFYAILVCGYLIRCCQCRADAAVIQQNVLADLRQCTEQGFLCGGIPVENTHGVD